MSKQTDIKIFEDKKVRTIWNSEKESILIDDFKVEIFESKFKSQK